MNNPPCVNYDAVASNYDLRASGGGYLAGVMPALQKLARQVKAQQVLDLGCGIGRSLQSFNDLALTRYGLDFSEGMLAQARRLEADYRLVRASALCPPFACASFDLVCCVLALHHFPDKKQVAQQAYRLLRSGGAFVIVNFDPREARYTWPVYNYFGGVYETDLERFPAMADQEAMLREAGFQQVSSPVVEHIHSELAGEAILDNYHLRKEASSQLILISDEAYQAGLERIRADIAAAKSRGAEIIFRTDIKNRMCHGVKPV
jgi:ubiquinone/menaquinone biosynthesis C-methylase UbiE